MITILVVEDDKKLNRLVSSFLEGHGYRTTGCLSLREALDAMIDTKFDLIISDIMMNEIDGFKFAQIVREQNKSIPILFMTARDDISAKQQGYKIGIDDYMVKPVNLEELTLRVEALLRRANITNEKK
jgi:DNA-binding response OmpR family regulator